MPINIHPVHYAPHHNGHQPICGARHHSDGGTLPLVIRSMERDEITCFKCIDTYEERAMTPEQVAALSQVRDDIDALFAEIEEQLLFDQGKRLTLHALNHMIQSLPWWAVVRRHRIASAMVDLRALKLSDVKGLR